MKQVKIVLILLLTLVISIRIAQASNDTVFVDRMMVSNSVATVLLNPLLPGESVESVSNKDDIIYYVANLGVINPTKQNYSIEIICIDSNRNTVFKASVKRPLSGFLYNVGGDIIKGVTQTLGLDTNPGSMVKGQLIPLKAGNDYFIKLYVEKKLIGVTKFHYMVFKGKE